MTMATTPSSTSTSTRVTTNSIQKAVKSLLKWNNNNNSNKPKPKTLNPSSSNDDFLYLVLTLNQIPPNFRTQETPFKIPLPHPLYSPYSPNFRICLLVKDPHSQSSKQKIETQQIPISNVIKLSLFRTKFNSFEERKNLCDSYDLFLADIKVVPSISKIIGRYFYKRKKGPIGIDLGKGDWKKEIEMVCGSTSLSLKNGSCCCVAKVARGSMSREEILENVGAAIDGVAQVVPKKWKNVRAFHLKFPESLALPVYEAKGGLRMDEEERCETGEVGKKRKL